MYKRILFPTDGSEASGRAASAAVDFARSVGAELFAMTAVPPFHTFTADTEMLEQTASGYKEASMARAARLLDEVAALARDAGVPCTCLQVEGDNPYEAIIATARQHGCDLIVMASHGRRGIQGLLLGSETQKVLVHSAIPVMVHR
ncbi:universal stress protein [Massilia sp. ST3]|uniref:universal stress protein n=1 Tax=Massilia sp. ST3 TaxID=2824903 RepID=UPI001B810B3B|nr:universal stress protein [Massilia sp. ST3]MBQ5948490.1 universal stress protein [Massilia sp. ST3]